MPARSPVRTHASLCSLLAAAAVLVTAASPRADVSPVSRVSPDAAASAAAQDHRHLVVAHVGPREVTAGDLEAHLARVPRYQLRTFGRTASEVVHGFFDQVMLRDILLSLGAEDKHLEREIEVEQSLDRMLSSATLRELINTVGPPNLIPPDEVQRYYDANRSRYESKERINIWRILCATRDEAASVLADAKKDGTVQTFTKLSRDHNKDRATALRGGNLGFVNEMGISNEPGVQVDPGVVKAAAAVKDGELVATPVQEGSSYAVVWRRGTQAGVHKSLEEVRVQIQDAIIRQKREVAQKALLEKLRAEKVSHVDESLLGSFDISIDDGTIGPKRKDRRAAAP